MGSDTVELWVSCTTCGKRAPISKLITIMWLGKPYRVHPGCKFVGAIGDPVSKNYNVNATRKE